MTFSGSSDWIITSDPIYSVEKDYRILLLSFFNALDELKNQ